MAEQKKKTIVSADSDEKLKNAKTVKPAKPVGNASGLRVGAVILWVVAIAFEVLALLVLLGKVNIHIGSSLVQLIIFLVLFLYLQVAIVKQLSASDVGNLRQVEMLGELGTYLGGITVDSLTASDDEVIVEHTAEA